MDKNGMERQRAVERYQRGESATEICASLGRSVRWLYKWIERAEQGGEWWVEQPRSRRGRGNRSSEQTEQLVVNMRQQLVRENGFFGAQSIAWELEEAEMPCPSIPTINRILSRHGLIDHTPERRPSKGRRYPAPAAGEGGGVHQCDFVGPRYLKKPIRFYSFNSVDVATGRCATVPIDGRSHERVIPALWQTWVQLGFPKIQQFDNELVFFGSRLHPRGLSQVLRLCLMHQVEPLFIPPAEPWRNGTIEKFNHHWQQKVLGQQMNSFAEVVSRSADFDARHNSRWRYRKNGGRTPNQALEQSSLVLRHPPSLTPPPSPLPRPLHGRYHFVRFVRSDRILEIFGQKFPLPADAVYEYVQATVDVASQQLRVHLDGRLLDVLDYSST